MSTGRISRGKGRALDEGRVLALLHALGRSTLFDWSAGLATTPQILSPVVQRLIKMGKVVRIKRKGDKPLLFMPSDALPQSSDLAERVETCKQERAELERLCQLAEQRKARAELMQSRQPFSGIDWSASVMRPGCRDHERIESRMGGGA